MTSLSDRHAAFVDALTAYEDATTEFAEALRHEQAMEANRHEVKQQAVLRLMQSENPAMPGKNYSATSAESYVELDAEYGGYLARQRAAVVARLTAYTKMESARLTGQMLAKGDY